MPHDLDPPRPDEAALQAERITQLESALRSRPVIEQAKGMLMLVLRCDEDHAFRRLIAVSQSSNRKLRDIATEIVETLRHGGSLPADVAALVSERE
jgi:AmiR/NasT family two-component response regulator